MSNDTILDIDALLDSNLKDVENVPDFVNPPAGEYDLGVAKSAIEKFESKAKDGKPAQKGLRIRIGYKVNETIDTKEAPVADGSMFSETFMANEDGLKYFKKQAGKILNVKDFGDTSIRDIIDALNATESFKAKITIRKSGDFENAQVQPIHATPAE